MASQQLPPTVSQQMLENFVTKYRLQRASLGTPGNMVTFFMNPDVTETHQWLVNYAPTGEGYVRWAFGAQYYTIQLQGTTGVIGYDSGDDTVGGMKQLFGSFSPGWSTVGNGNQNKLFTFIYPALGLTTQCYIDMFSRSITSAKSLYTFFNMTLTVLPPKIAQDYEPLPAVGSGLPGTLNAPNGTPGALTAP